MERGLFIFGARRRSKRPGRNETPGGGRKKRDGQEQWHRARLLRKHRSGDSVEREDGRSAGLARARAPAGRGTKVPVDTCTRFMQIRGREARAGRRSFLGHPTARVKVTRRSLSPPGRDFARREIETFLLPRAKERERERERGPPWRFGLRCLLSGPVINNFFTKQRVAFFCGAVRFRPL